MLYLVDIFEFEFMKFRRVGLTLLAVLLCIQCSFATEYLLWLGYTQTGKSSCIKQLTGHESIEVGNSQKWKSTTERITIYHDRLNKLAHNYSHIDTIGFGDNRLDQDFTDKQIRQNVQNAIISQSKYSQTGEIKCIIVTESYFSDIIKLPIVFNHIKNILGYLPVKSIVVLLTKKNLLAYPKGAENKRKAIVAQLQTQHSISPNNVIDFMTHWDEMPDIKVESDQYELLERAISGCEPITSDSINAKHEKIKQMAKTIQSQLTRKITKSFEYPQEEIQTTTIKKQHAYAYYEPWPILGIFGFGTRRSGTIPYNEEVYTKNVVMKNKTIEETIIPDIDDCHQMALAKFEIRMLNDANANDEEDNYEEEL